MAEERVEQACRENPDLLLCCDELLKAEEVFDVLAGDEEE